MGLRAAAETVIHQCMNLQSNESCAVVTDDELEEIGQLIYEVGSDVTSDCVFIKTPPGTQHGAEPPAPVAGAMNQADVVVAPTTKSLSHTRARQNASEAGARIATMPGITETVMIAGLDADYDEIKTTCDEMLDLLEDATHITVTSPQGTDITFDVSDREWRDDTGINHTPGDFSNLPAGEVFISPRSANGTYVVDGTMRPYGKLDGRLLEFTVEDGYVTNISDDDIRNQVETAADQVGNAAYNLAELGIGTNLGVTELVGSVLLDEKAAGTVHIAIGDDAGIGGDTDAPIHLDGILTEPTVIVDGTELTLPTKHP